MASRPRVLAAAPRPLLYPELLVLRQRHQRLYLDGCELQVFASEEVSESGSPQARSPMSPRPHQGGVSGQVQVMRTRLRSEMQLMDQSKDERKWKGEVGA